MSCTFYRGVTFRICTLHVGMIPAVLNLNTIKHSICPRNGTWRSAASVGMSS
jgi:hypothetical protein